MTRFGKFALLWQKFKDLSNFLRAYSRFSQLLYLLWLQNLCFWADLHYFKWLKLKAKSIHLVTLVGGSKSSANFATVLNPRINYIMDGTLNVRELWRSLRFLSEIDARTRHRVRSRFSPEIRWLRRFKTRAVVVCQVVDMFAFYSNDPSLNPAYYVKFVFEKSTNKQKETVVGPCNVVRRGIGTTPIPYSCDIRTRCTRMIS